MERWVMLRKGADFEMISEKFHVSKWIASLIRNRDVVGVESIDFYLNGSLDDLHSGFLMKDMEKAAAILRQKLKEKKPIRVIGDYDVDGINATYVLYEGLKRLGGIVDYDIPERLKDGYGLNRRLLEQAYGDGIDTIVTCDNGISAREEIEYGKSMGMTIIVTDHHEVPFDETNGKKVYKVPKADAVIDQKQSDCPYPFKELCGAAVAYKLMECLYQVMECGKENILDLIENVAMATVADIMELVGENRIFVREGLRMIGHTKNKGLKALITCNGLDPEHLTAYSIGFVIGPCLNASGRLDTAKRALRMLTAKDPGEADLLAGELKALNENRKDMTARAVEEAVSLIESTELRADPVLVVYLPKCHESLAGIVAGKIREKYYRPVYVLTDGEEGVKGSGRSIEGYSMYEKLNRCAPLLTKFGGHTMAAGFSLPKENVDEFRRLLNADANLTEEDLTEKVVIDMVLPFSVITEEFIRDLSLLEPFGKGNAKPVFAARNVKLKNPRIMGKNRNVFKAFGIDESGKGIDVLAFGDVMDVMETVEKNNGILTITFYPQINEFRGEKTPQIVVTHYR